MILTKVTMTGADDNTGYEDLFELSEKYPFVEWAILLSRSSKGHNRFPSQKWMEDLANCIDRYPTIHLSGHLCGSYVRELLKGDTAFLKECRPLVSRFQRFQINTHGLLHETNVPALIEFIKDNGNKEFIFQYDNVNTDALKACIQAGCSNISALFDLSHGAGILPESWPQPLKGVKCGYAGGLGPNNIISQLLNLEKTLPADAEIWIDMETKVRSANDRIFDLDKVEYVLKICSDRFATALQ